jgi:hypothetical protein
MAGISRDDVARRAGDALYTAVGLGVLGVQHLQVQRREASRAFDGARSRLGQQMATLDETFEVVDEVIDERVDETLAALEPPLAGPARTCVRQALVTARSARNAALATARVALGDRPTDGD